MTPIRTLARCITAELSSRIDAAYHSSRDARTEQGDVPGWVMITLMTAALVVLIWAIAGPALTDLFNNAIQRVLNL